MTSMHIHPLTHLLQATQDTIDINDVDIDDVEPVDHRYFDGVQVEVNLDHLPLNPIHRSLFEYFDTHHEEFGIDVEVYDHCTVIHSNSFDFGYLNFYHEKELEEILDASDEIGFPTGMTLIFDGRTQRLEVLINQ